MDVLLIAQSLLSSAIRFFDKVSVVILVGVDTCSIEVTNCMMH